MDPTLVLIAQAVFLLARGQTDRHNRQTQLNALPTPAAVQPAWVMTDLRSPRKPLWKGKGKQAVGQMHW